MKYHVYGISGTVLFKAASFMDAYEANKYADFQMKQNPETVYVAIRIDEFSFEFLNTFVGNLKFTLVIK